MSSFWLPTKIDSYLATLSRLYERAGEKILREIVVNGIVSIHEEWTYDNWNGGTYGHAITLAIPEDMFLNIVDNKGDIQNRLRDDINKLDNSQNEHIAEVFIEMTVTESDRWREQSGVYRPPTATLSLPSEALERIWGSQRVRVFLSHKCTIKKEARDLKQAFGSYGIAAFVAHEDIKPTEEWLREIERALFSMDALVALLTDDFHGSEWTDQEVGVAIGRGVPLIAVMLPVAPYGLMGKAQGLGGCSLANTADIASRIFSLLQIKLADKARLFDCALDAYAASVSWEHSAAIVKSVLSRFDKLTESQVERLVKVYRANVENRASFKGMNLLKPLLEKWTGENWTVLNNELFPAKEAERRTEDIPF